MSSLPRVSSEPRSKVTFEIEPIDDMVKLTVVHEGFPAESEVLKSVSGGWPIVIASMKSLLETGEPLRTGPRTESKA